MREPENRKKYLREAGCDGRGWGRGSVPGIRRVEKENATLISTRELGDKREVAVHPFDWRPRRRRAHQPISDLGTKC